VVDGRGNRDLVSTSSTAMQMTLRGGAASDVLLGGPGDDVLVGGDDFDDVDGGGGDDSADLGNYFDLFTWNPGDGNVDASGLSALVELTLLDPFDRLALLTGGGNDSVDSSGLPPGIVELIVD
jgi:Ca2+-binding RTX toxin-like protein